MTENALQLHGLIAQNTATQNDAPMHHQVDCGPITALVTEVAELDALAHQTPDALANSAMAHHLILSAYCDQNGVLPFRFGTFFRTSQALQTALSQDRDRYVVALSDVANLREFTLRVGRAARTIAPQTPTAETGRAHLAARLQRRQHRDNATARQRSFVEQLLKDTAAQAVQVTKAHQTNPDDPSRHVLLLAKDGVKVLRAQLDSKASHAAALGLTLTLDGPWPPYSYDIDAPPRAQVRHAS